MSVYVTPTASSCTTPPQFGSVWVIREYVIWKSWEGVGEWHSKSPRHPCIVTANSSRGACERIPAILGTKSVHQFAFVLVGLNGNPEHQTFFFEGLHPIEPWRFNEGGGGIKRHWTIAQLPPEACNRLRDWMESNLDGQPVEVEVRVP